MPINIESDELLSINSFYSFKTARALIEQIRETAVIQKIVDTSKIPPALIGINDEGQIHVEYLTRECISETSETGLDITPVVSSMFKWVREENHGVEHLAFILPSHGYENTDPNATSHTMTRLVSNEEARRAYENQLGITTYVIFLLDAHNNKIIYQDYIYSPDGGWEFSIPAVEDLVVDGPMNPAPDCWDWDTINAMNVIATLSLDNN